jgi:hypothetical protein
MPRRFTAESVLVADSLVRIRAQFAFSLTCSTDALGVRFFYGSMLSPLPPTSTGRHRSSRYQHWRALVRRRSEVGLHGNSSGTEMASVGESHSSRDHRTCPPPWIFSRRGERDRRRPARSRQDDDPSFRARPSGCSRYQSVRYQSLIDIKGTRERLFVSGICGRSADGPILALRGCSKASREYHQLMLATCSYEDRNRISIISVRRRS